MSNNQITLQAEAEIPTDYGKFMMKAYALSESNAMPHIVFASPDLDNESVVTLRIHSECITGDLFHSNRCDCGEQLEESMKIVQRDKGMIIYLRQEGRGIGIINKLKAYNKQDEGYDTIEANLMLGFDADLREFNEALEILKLEKISKVRLLTNNPQKMKIFDNSEIELIERIPLIMPPKEENLGYIKTKKQSLGHLFDAQ